MYIKVSSVWAQKLICPSSAWLGSQPSQLGSAQLGKFQHELITNTYLILQIPALPFCVGYRGPRECPQAQEPTNPILTCPPYSILLICPTFLNMGDIFESRELFDETETQKNIPETNPNFTVYNITYP